MILIDYLLKLFKERHLMKPDTKKSLVSKIYPYLVVIYMWLTIKPNQKEKWHLAYGSIFLLVMKLRINGEFEMIHKFLLEGMLSLINLSSDTKMSHIQN